MVGRDRYAAGDPGAASAPERLSGRGRKALAGDRQRNALGTADKACRLRRLFRFDKRLKAAAGVKIGKGVQREMSLISAPEDHALPPPTGCGWCGCTTLRHVRERHRSRIRGVRVRHRRVRRDAAGERASRIIAS